MNIEKLLLTLKIDKYENRILYMAEDAGFLMDIDLDTFEVRVVARFSSTEYRTFTIEKDNVLLFPSNGNVVCRYSLCDDSYYYFEIPKDIHLKSENNWSAHYVRCDDDLFFFWASPVITRYDIEKNKWTAYRDWVDLLSQNRISFDGFSFGGFITDNREAVFHIRNSKYCVKIDIESGKQSLLQLHFDDFRLEHDMIVHSMTCFDEGILVQTVSDEGIVEVYEGDLGGRITKRIGSARSNPNNRNPFNVVFRLADYVYLLPGENSCAYRINIHSGKTHRIDEIEISSIEKKKSSKYPFDFWYGEVIEGKWYGINVQTNMFVIIDGKDGSIECNTLYTPKRKENIGKQLLKYGSYVEDEDFRMESFVDYIIQCQ